MEISRRGPGEACLTEAGRELLDLVAAEASEAEFDQLVARLQALLDRPPRLAVTYREGLLEQVQADTACEVVLIEDDPHDEPPLRLRRHQVAADAAALEALLNEAERRLARGLR